MVYVGAETTDDLPREAKVDGFVPLEFLVLFRRQQRQKQIARVVSAQHWSGRRSEFSVHAQRHWRSGDQQQVRSAAARGVRQQLVERGGTLRNVRRRATRSRRCAVQLGHDQRKFVVIGGHVMT